MLSGEIFEFKKKGEKCLSCGKHKANIGELNCQDCKSRHGHFMRKLQGRKMKIQDNGNYCDR